MAKLKDQIRKIVLILQEVPLHPHTVLKQLEDCFEKPSIVRVSRRDGLRQYNKPPVYDDRYLVLFEDKRIFESNINFLHLDFMLPVVICPNKNMTASVKEVCQEKSVPYSIYVNAFTKEVAEDFIRELASVPVTKDFCQTLRRRVGLSPQRIISAVMVCEQVGYKTANITKYVDKYVYIDVYDALESLLGICKSKAQVCRAALYIHLNRFWYSKYTRAILVSEVGTLIQIYRDLLDGTLTAYTMQEYELEKSVPRYRILYAIDLYERINLNQLLALKQFLSEASILEVTMKLS